ncbi:uncharacterized protein KY384_002585 [Bacidia gigantensis]|uniref:uncharacterized protein n=1 Tax=Bacidia gigantensis TaxID=2732470 RepID=UPI001D0400A8|nr:uncharacterized protein KY384_002585 [Bacidia gigantensis]KAG8532708.1 hypothetical protein KY384_002585 [Bacidia gigantensis]
MLNLPSSFAQRKATNLLVTGWVQNTPDEKVIGEAQGTQDALQGYLKELNSGPRASHVVKVEKKEISWKEDEKDFQIR